MLPTEFDVTDKVVLITGAGRGIGKGIAEVLAEAGADIALNALTSRHVEDTARRIGDASGRRVLPLVADVTRSEQVQEVVDTVIKQFGRIDVLINNLGDAIFKPLVKLPDKQGETISDGDLKSVVDINLTAALLCTRAVGPHLLERRGGKVINISSYTALRGGREAVLYSMAKAAVVGFTRTQALEWAPYNVRVNAIAPGLFPDPVSHGERGIRALEEYAARKAPLGRTGRLREVGLLALYLASPASDYMTGQTLYLDGGMTL
ncbi:MAG: SDR family oxidoreductase [Deltaproteobacteria bacterium]|nr:SDR family oxidoreductase [Deltaproteobacteria bacterium]